MRTPRTSYEEGGDAPEGAPAEGERRAWVEICEAKEVSERLWLHEERLTYKPNTGSPLAEMVVAPEEVEDGEMDAPEVVLGERFKRWQVGCERAEAVQQTLHDVAFRWRWWFCGKKGIQRSSLEASLLGGFRASEKGPPKGRVDASEEVGAGDVKEEKYSSFL
jgi:hypothetical protein